MGEPILIEQYVELRTTTTLATGFKPGEWVVEIADGVFEKSDPPPPPKKAPAKKKPAAKKAPAKKKPAAKKK